MQVRRFLHRLAESMSATTQLASPLAPFGRPARRPYRR